MVWVSIGDQYPSRKLPLDQALGVATQLHQENDLERARHVYRSILQAIPEQFDANHLLGVLLLQLGDPAAAVIQIRRALKLQPDHADAWCNLGNALRHQEDPEGAHHALERALELDPKLPAAHNALGALFHQQQQYRRAADHYRKALAQQPGQVAARANLAASCLALGDMRAAEREASLALDARADFAPALKCRGVARAALGRSDEALKDLAAAAASAEADADSHYQHGMVLEEQGRWDTALDAMKTAVAKKPGFAGAVSAALFLARRLYRWDEVETLEPQLLNLLKADSEGIQPFGFLSLPSTPAQQLHCAKLWGRRIRAGITQLPPVAPRVAKQSITVGYLSSGFRQHPTACLTAELFECHDRQRFRTIAYSVGPDDRSEMRARLVRAFDQFHHLQGHAFAAVAQQIRDDQVDVLVDLRGYGGGAVSEVMAMRPAPIQVNWLAYPGTMGAAFMDYILVDHFVAPEPISEHFSEATVCLPGAYQPTDTTRPIDSHSPTRGACGLPEDAMVYCSFNNSYKLSAATFAVWMQILNAVEGSVLWLLAGKAGASSDENLRHLAIQHGIDPQRLVFIPGQSHLEYLARYRLADLFLDTAPYNAHTTASDALWAGCPVLTCPGETFASRVAGSLCHSAGLAETVMENMSDYRDLAIELGRDAGQRTALRQRLLAARGTASLFQTPIFCRQLENAYAEMVRRWHDGLPPVDFSVARC